ncbi:alpha/beta fold hydrolase [Phytohabitans kaempferiae]|uniref:Alpha/beta fold hydrolase n=1 Tax=Phytohabitans kaempferiae TaxID=1620943 RepID=A0ABV6LVA4_9ACTN
MDLRVAVGDGVHLRVRRHEGAREPSFLLVHGLASNALLWDEVAAELSRAGYASYAVDLRGHGESDLPEGGFDSGTVAADLAAVAMALDLDDLVVVGQSWGGNVVVRLAAEHPALVRALALVDGGWSDLSEEFASWEECEAALRPPEVDGLRAEEMRLYLRGAHPDWSPVAIEATIANLRAAPDGTLVRRLPIPEHMKIVRDMWDDPPLRFYPALAMPVLLVPAMPRQPGRAARTRARVEAAARLLVRAMIREYRDGDHDLHAQQPQRLAADLLELA